jgi:hypothetical protein
MIRRVRFPGFPIAAANGAPVGAVGIHLGQSFGTFTTHASFLLQVRLAGGAGGPLSADLFLWGQRIQLWGPQGDDDGQLNGGVALTGTTERIYYKVLCNQSFFDRVYLEARNVGASTTSIDANLYIGVNSPPPE